MEMLKAPGPAPRSGPRWAGPPGGCSRALRSDLDLGSRLSGMHSAAGGDGVSPVTHAAEVQKEAAKPAPPGTEPGAEDRRRTEASLPDLGISDLVKGLWVQQSRGPVFKGPSPAEEDGEPVAAPGLWHVPPARGAVVSGLLPPHLAERVGATHLHRPSAQSAARSVGPGGAAVPATPACLLPLSPRPADSVLPLQR